MSECTVAIERCIDRLRAGESEVRGELLNHAFERLQRMTQKMKRGYDRVGRWEQTDDVVQNASLRLFAALGQVEIADARHFFRLAALQIRRELLDMCRHYYGPQGHAANHHTQLRQPAADQSARPEVFDRAELTADPHKMQEWGEFHAFVQELPETEREVVDLLWYHELSQEEAAQVLGVSTRHVKRLWRSAKLLLHARMQGEVPGEHG
jgi:RNA polymerase sigma-70 factor (ECF subfamily)